MNNLSDSLAVNLTSSKNIFSEAQNTQAYYNIPYGIHEAIFKFLRPVFAYRYILLYKICRSGKDPFTLPYSYLSKIFNCCIKTAQRTMDYLQSKGFLVKNHTYKNNYQKSNSYRLIAPMEALSLIKNATKRKKEMPDICYSVDHESIEDERPYFPEESKVSPKEYSKDGDTRGLLDLNKPLPSGKIGGLLSKMKDKFKPGPKPEPVGSGFKVYADVPSLDTSVQGNILNIKNIYKKDPIEHKVNIPESNPAHININNYEEEPIKPPRELPDWLKRELRRFIINNKLISDKQQVYTEALYFIANNHGYGIKYSLNIFKKLIREDKWRTPISFKYTDDYVPPIKENPPSRQRLPGTSRMISYSDFPNNS